MIIIAGTEEIRADASGRVFIPKRSLCIPKEVDAFYAGLNDENFGIRLFPEYDSMQLPFSFAGKRIELDNQNRLNLGDFDKYNIRNKWVMLCGHAAYIDVMTKEHHEAWRSLKETQERHDLIYSQCIE